MEANTPKTEVEIEKKCVSKAKSHITEPSIKVNMEPTKRKSFNANDAVKSLDVAGGRLKKSKLVEGEYSSAHTSPVRRGLASSMFIDSLTDTHRSGRNHGADSASIMSLNFSHYELIRNLSCTNSDSAFSSTTCNALSASDIMSKNEHLERYFRSLDTWGGSCSERLPRRTSTSDAQLNIVEK